MEVVLNRDRIFSKTHGSQKGKREITASGISPGSSVSSNMVYEKEISYSS